MANSNTSTRRTLSRELLTLNTKTAFPAPRSTAVYGGLGQKTADISSTTGVGLQGWLDGSANISTFAPEIRNPTLNPEMFFLPKFVSVDGTPNIELNSWLRHYLRWHPLVNNLIQLHSTLPISRFGLVGISDKKVLQYFEDNTDELMMFERLMEMLLEYFGLGEVAPFAKWDRDKGKFTELKLLNPDYLNVSGHYMLNTKNGEIPELYEYIPDEYLKTMIRTDNPFEQDLLDNHLDDELRYAIENNYTLMLDPFCLTFIRRKLSPWDLRGTSMLTNILKILLLEDKLRAQQYSSAEQNINPIRHWTVGNDVFVADDARLQAMENLVRQVQNDPQANYITDHTIKLEMHGAVGSTDKMKDDFEYIENQILTGLWSNKAFTHCFTPDHEYLTKDGWKFYNEITEADELGTFNPETKELTYENFTKRFEYDVDEDLVHFKNNWVDLKVTKNHGMLVKEKFNTYNSKDSNWKKVLAGEINYDFKIPNVINWRGEKSEEEAVIVNIYGRGDNKNEEIRIPINDYLRLIGYFISEGSFRFEKRNGDPYASCVNITQQPSSKSYATMKELFDRLNFFKVEDTKDRNNWACYKRCIAEHIHILCGHGSKNKRIPRHLLNLKPEKLKILLDALMDGDGSRFSTLKSGEINQNRYHTISPQLADDVQELAFKLGYAVRVERRKRDETRQDIYWICWGRKESEMTRSGYSNNPTVYTDEIEYEKYKGKVHCFELPSYHTLVVRRNGVINITFNSEGITYNSATVGMRVLMGRYLPIRSMFENYFYRKIFLPTSLAQDFYKPLTQAQSSHGIRPSNKDRELQYPLFDWRHKQSLMDDQSVRSMLQTLHEKGLLAFKVILDSIDVDYNYNKTWKEKELNTILDTDLMSARKTVVESAGAGGLKDSGEGITKRMIDASVNFVLGVLGKSPNIQVKETPEAKKEKEKSEEEKPLGGALEPPMDSNSPEDIEKQQGFYSTQYRKEQEKNRENINRKYAEETERQIRKASTSKSPFVSSFSKKDTIVEELKAHNYDESVINSVRGQLYDLRILLAQEGERYIKSAGTLTDSLKLVLNTLNKTYYNRLSSLNNFLSQAILNTFNKDTAVSECLIPDLRDRYALKASVQDVTTTDKNVRRALWSTIYPKLETQIINNFISCVKTSQLTTLAKLGMQNVYLNNKRTAIKDVAPEELIRVSSVIVPDTEMKVRKTFNFKKCSIKNCPLELLPQVIRTVDKINATGEYDFEKISEFSATKYNEDVLKSFLTSKFYQINNIKMEDMFSTHMDLEDSEIDWWLKHARKYVYGEEMDREIKEFVKQNI